MSKHEDADLILKLYDLRREPTMRIARDWWFRDFHPDSIADIQATLFGEHSGHMRMVMTYWDMAAALVNHGAIDIELFNDTNGEHFVAFAKLEPFLEDIRKTLGPNSLKNLEKLVDATPQGRERSAMVRERMKSVRAELAARQAKASQSH